MVGLALVLAPVKLTVTVEVVALPTLLNVMDAPVYDMAGTVTPLMVSRTVPPAADNVLITAVEADGAVAGVVSPVTVQTTATAFRLVLAIVI